MCPQPSPSLAYASQPEVDINSEYEFTDEMNTAFREEDSRTPAESNTVVLQFHTLIAQSRNSIFKGTLTYQDETTDVAIKVVSLDSPSKIKSFYIEDKILRLCTHPNILKTLHEATKQIVEPKFGQSQTIGLMCLEYAQHGDLFRLLKRNRRLSAKLARTMFHALVGGVKHLHARKIVHTDLKLENILIGMGFKLKIADFDLSAINPKEKFTSRGTVCFRAPELISGSSMDPYKADLYSLGIILFALIVGHFPYWESNQGEFDNLYQAFYNKRDEFWQMHEEHISETFKVPLELKVLIAGMLEMEVSQRWTFNQVTASAWYNGSVYDSKAYIARMKTLF